MVRLDRVLVSSHKLPIVTMSLSAAVWPQSATHLYFGQVTEDCVLLKVMKEVRN